MIFPRISTWTLFSEPSKASTPRVGVAGCVLISHRLTSHSGVETLRIMLTDHRIKRLWNSSHEMRKMILAFEPSFVWAVCCVLQQHQNKSRRSDEIIFLLTSFVYLAQLSAFIVSWFHQLNSSTWKRLKTTCLILQPTRTTSTRVCNFRSAL